MIDSGESLLYILNEILDFSKIEAGKMDLEQGPVDIRDMLNSVMELFSIKASEKILSFTVKYRTRFRTCMRR